MSNIDTPLKFKRVQREDMTSFSWNECPTCKNSIGYHPKDKNFRCNKCGQRIDWGK